jgi:hypothetical protein
MADDIETEAKRQSAAYARTIGWLRHTQPHLSDEEMDARGLAANDEAVFGHDANRDRNGEFIQQGIGSPGHETQIILQAYFAGKAESVGRLRCGICGSEIPNTPSGSASRSQRERRKERK